MIASEHWDLIAAHYHAMPRPYRSKVHPLLRLSLNEFTGHVYAWAVERVDPEEFDEWKQDLTDLLPWQTRDSQAAVDIESASFFAMQNAGG